MNVFKGLMCAGVVGTGMFVGAPQEADAGSFYLNIGGSRPYYSGYGYRNYGYGHRGYGHGYGGRVWHDTSHYDYHPGGLVPHGNHYHYIPGHYHWHNDGHWDHYGHGHYGHYGH